MWLEGEVALPAEVIARRESLGFFAPATHFNIADLVSLDIDTAVRVLDGIQLQGNAATIAGPVLREVGHRLAFLRSVGLGYLALARRISTLSGGEAQRIRLATQVGTGTVGAAYVLDEPTIGLHPRDNARLLKTLRHLADAGNSVIVVEHDEEVIREADHLLDIGPGPGVHGGQLVAQGSPDAVAAEASSLTAEYLSGRRRIAVPSDRRPLADAPAVVVRGARAHNLRDLTVRFPLGGLVCVTGVSGSGKSTLVTRTLLPALQQSLRGPSSGPAKSAALDNLDGLDGLEHVQRVIQVDQSPIGRTPRSNPATYTGIFDEIRKLYAQTKEARLRAYAAGRFSFNVRGGRCEVCQGQGVRRIEMHFLPDVFVECEACHGQRYNAETLAVQYRGKNIADTLAMTIEEAAEFFSAHPRIHRTLACLADVGLGYIRLGQASTTLSGGEAQRIKLAAELTRVASTAIRRRREHVCYVLDEPTTGLHFEDVRRLIEVLERLVAEGHTVLVIEHHLDVIKRADWVIDLGPEGGHQGGELIAEGPPEAIAAQPASLTGKFLRDVLR